MILVRILQEVRQSQMDMRVQLVPVQTLETDEYLSCHMRIHVSIHIEKDNGVK